MQNILFIFAILLFTGLLHIAASKLGFTCEHKNLNLECLEGYFIKVHSAKYGRDRGDTTSCLHASVFIHRAKIMSNNCEASSSFANARFSCNHKQKCTLTASNSVFSDPCEGIFKYLRVYYKCFPDHPNEVSYSKVACEDTSLILTCNTGQTLRIASAQYGRDKGDMTTCFRSNMRSKETKIRSTNCDASRSWAKVSAACDYQKECAISASNGVFGDPCEGVFKYLRVVYKCTNKPSAKDFKQKVACEHKNLNLVCPRGEILKIKYANYGRDKGDMTTCSRSGIKSQETKIKSRNCGTTFSLKKIKIGCDNEEECTILASNSIFGDPCEGVFKYLRVIYDCVPVALRKYEIYSKTDYLNNNIQQLKYTTVDKCAAVCTARKDCVGFIYHNIEKSCWTKYLIIRSKLKFISDTANNLYLKTW